MSQVSDMRYPGTGPELYLEEAKRCEAAAAGCVTPQARESYLKLAADWRALALKAMTGERGLPTPNPLFRPDHPIS